MGDMSDVKKSLMMPKTLAKLVDQESSRVSSDNRMAKIASELVLIAKELVGQHGEPGKSYDEVNDAVDNENVPDKYKAMLKDGSTEIWYMQPDESRNLGVGYDFIMKHYPYKMPDPKNLKKTHILLGKIGERNPDKIFGVMQGERWSPMGEANDLVRRKGLHHTSMSVGDIIKIGNKVFFVDMSGFKRL